MCYHLAADVICYYLNKLKGSLTWRHVTDKLFSFFLSLAQFIKHRHNTIDADISTLLEF